MQPTSAHDNIRPEITGIISEEPDCCLIELSFRLPEGMKSLFILLLVFNSLVWLFFMFFNINEEMNKIFPIGIPVAVIGFFLMALYIFNLKSKEAIDDLSFIFGAREINN